jgi:hypothetical protein
MLVELETPNLILRKLDEADAPATNVWESELHDGHRGTPWPHTTRRAHPHLRARVRIRDSGW